MQILAGQMFLYSISCYRYVQVEYPLEGNAEHPCNPSFKGIIKKFEIANDSRVLTSIDVKG